MVAAQRLVLDVHGIGAMPSWVEPDEARYWCDAASTFEAILDAIPDATAASGVPIELTFDDGNLSDATIATPALVKRNLKGAFFVCAGRIGETGYLDRSAMMDMLDAGMTIGSHGWSHVDWRRVDDETLEQERPARWPRSASSSSRMTKLGSDISSRLIGLIILPEVTSALPIREAFTIP